MVARGKKQKPYKRANAVRPYEDSKNFYPTNGGSKPPPYKGKSAFPKMFASFFNLRTQKLKLHHFASCCAERKRSAHKDALQGSKGH